MKAKLILGESGDVREETVHSWKEKLPEYLEGWVPQNIWNVSETDQFFRTLLNRSLVEGSKNCTGVKKVKGETDVCFFFNTNDGKLIVIGKSAKPRCFKGILGMDKLPCKYYNQGKAWTQSRIMLQILSKLDKR